MDKTTLFSFGTGISREFLKPEEPTNPHGIDIAFWLNWLMTANGQDASAMVEQCATKAYLKHLCPVFYNKI